MSSVASRPLAAARARIRRDPTVAAAVLSLWLLLALFVIYPWRCCSRACSSITARSPRPGSRPWLPTGIRCALSGTACCWALWSASSVRCSAFSSPSPAARGQLPRWLLTAIDAAVLLPLVSPPFTTAIAMIFSFGPRGLITYELLGIKGYTVYGLTSTLFSEAVTYFPIAYLTLRPILAAIDSNIEGMALSLGATRWRVFRTVTLPLTIPGFANAFLLLFAASLADFATTVDSRRQ